MAHPVARSYPAAVKVALAAYKLMEEVAAFEPGELSAAIDGFSLHAQVHVGAGDREHNEGIRRFARSAATVRAAPSLAA